MKADGRTKVTVPQCEIPNTMLDLEFKLTETHNSAQDGGDSDEEGSPNMR